VILIPIQVGDRKALVERPDKPKCCVPGCKGGFWTTCDYPVKRGGKDATCDARLCSGHIWQWGELDICPSHGRLVARAK
jgi:hypothetical protein